MKCEKSEEEFDRLLEEHTGDLVNKLMEDEESASTHSVLPTSPPPTAPIQPQPPQNIVPDTDKWYYCDPQRIVQGKCGIFKSLIFLLYCILFRNISAVLLCSL